MLQPKMNGGGGGGRARGRRRDHWMDFLPWDIVTLPGGPGIPGSPVDASPPLSGWFGPGERGEPVAPPQRGVGPPDVFNILQGIASPVVQAPLAALEIGAGLGAQAGAAMAPAPAPAPGLPAPAWGPQVVGDMGGEAIWGPLPVFMQQYGLGGDWLNPYQRWQLGYADPLHDVFQLQQQMGLQAGAPEAVWEDYLQPFQAGMAPAYGQAGGVLGGLMGMGAEGRAGAGIDFGTGSLAQLTNLLRLALRPHLGLHGAAAVARMLPRQRAQMLAGEAGGAAPVTFLDHLRQKFNLQRFGF